MGIAFRIPAALNKNTVSSDYGPSGCPELYLSSFCATSKR